MALRDSTLYDNLHVSNFLGDARDHQGRTVTVPFRHTVISGELGGASAGVSDEVNLCVLPANCEVRELFVDWGVLGASGAAGVTVDLGDSGDANRYFANADMDAAGQEDRILTAGYQFRPTADTIVVLQWGGANPVVGIVIKGHFTIVPGT